jgi:hypothetical protein
MSGDELELARLTALYVDGLTGSLAAAESAELADLLVRHPDFDTDSLDAALAALQAAVLPVTDELPALLHEQLAVDAADFFAGVPATAAGATVAAAASAPSAATASRAPRSSPRSSPRAPWLIAAGVAALAMAFLAGRERSAAPSLSPPATTTPVATAPASGPGAGTATLETAPIVADAAPAPAAGPSPEPASGPPEPAAARRSFLAAHRFVVQRSWQAGTDPLGARVRGDVVWDPKSQTGFLRFVGLARNNPLTEQYQLWIFDGRRQQPYPVDGGVFDVTARDGEEVVIPIRSKLHVEFAMTFAVTVERPGGVVVSDRSRVAAIAQIS